MPLFCIACDSFLSVKGEVYEWLDAPAAAGSVIYLDSIPPNDMRVAPLPEVEITLEHWPNDAAQHRARMTTDTDGRFSGGFVVGSGRFAATVSANAAGFRSAARAFRHEGQPHTVRVLLVRER
jgi:hypothetical protein